MQHWKPSPSWGVLSGAMRRSLRVSRVDRSHFHAREMRLRAMRRGTVPSRLRHVAAAPLRLAARSPKTLAVEAMGLCAPSLGSAGATLPRVTGAAYFLVHGRAPAHQLDHRRSRVALEDTPVASQLSVRAARSVTSRYTVGSRDRRRRLAVFTVARGSGVRLGTAFDSSKHASGSPQQL